MSAPSMLVHQEPVILNIYDLCCINHCSFCFHLGLGVHHSGVEIYGTEFGFDGHAKDASGIFEIEPRRFVEPDPCSSFKTSIVMGHTSLTQLEVYEALEQLGNDFKGFRYHCLHKNCNHFSSALTKLLCDKEVPGWVNRLAYVATCIPFLEKMLITTEEVQARKARAPAAPAAAPPSCNVSAKPEDNNNNTIVKQPKPKIKWLYSKTLETGTGDLPQKTPQTV